MIRYIILLAIFSAGVGAIVFSFHPLENLKDSETWQTTDAVITSSEIQKNETRKKTPGSSTYKTRITYQPKVTFIYTIDGKEYRGDRINFSYQSYSDIKEAKEIQGSYPVDKEISVFYNPEDPAESVVSRDAQALFLITYFGILISCWAAWYMIKPFVRKTT